MLLSPKQNIIYGPVSSRRLGRSLGINLLGSKSKICTFNCLYCQYGWTQFYRVEQAVESSLPKVPEILKAVEAAIVDMESPPTNLTFSGNGEPTLHPDFADIVDGVAAIRDRLCPSTRIAMLSNASTLGEPAVMRAVARLDDPIMKLDAGDERTFKRYNQPGISVEFNEIMRYLGNLEDVVIQSLFTAGDAGNFTPTNIANWVEKIRLISPRFVQIYSLARDFPSQEIMPVQKESLEEIKAELTRSGISSEVY